MMRVSATELKNRLGQYLETSLTEPLIIEKMGRAVSVLISNSVYEKLMQMEDAFWAAKAAEAEKSGYIGTESLSRLMNLNERMSVE